MVLCWLQVPPPAWSNAAEAYQKTLDTVHLSLQRMGLEYIDLMLLHAAGAAEGRPEAWRALESAQKQVRHPRNHSLPVQGRGGVMQGQSNAAL